MLKHNHYPNRRLRLVNSRGGKSTPTQPPASTTWRYFTTIRENTSKRSHCMCGCSPSVNNSWDRSTLIQLSFSPIWQDFTTTRESTKRQNRSCSEPLHQ